MLRIERMQEQLQLPLHFGCLRIESLVAQPQKRQLASALSQSSLALAAAACGRLLLP